MNKNGSVSKVNKLLVLFPDVISDIDKKGNLDTILELINPNAVFDKVFISYFDNKTLSTPIRNNIFSFSIKKSCFAFDYFRALVILSRLIRKERISIIRAYSPLTEGLLGLGLKIITKVPFVVSVHRDIDFDYENIYRKTPQAWKWRILTIIKRISLRKADMVFAVSNYIKKVLVRDKVDINKIRVIHHGIKKEVFLNATQSSIRQSLGIGDSPLILFVKRLTKENYVEDIILAMPGVLKEFPSSCCLILGKGPQESELKNLSYKLGIGNKIKFLGFKSSEEVSNYMHSADVNLCTFAGFTLIEAAASEKPVVAYDVEWHSELIEHNKNGILVKFRDITGLTDAIIFLLKNPEIGKEYGRRAKETVLKDYTLEESSNRVMRFYRELL